jgi:hypothetical protein
MQEEKEDEVVEAEGMEGRHDGWRGVVGVGVRGRNQSS